MEKVDIYSMTVTGEAEEGPGGYGTILRWKDREGKFHQKTMAQGQTYTDQLSLSLEGLIAGLIELGGSCQVDLYTDQVFIYDAIRLKWTERWVKEGFQRKKIRLCQTCNAVDGTN